MENWKIGRSATRRKRNPSLFEITKEQWTLVPRQVNYGDPRFLEYLGHLEDVLRFKDALDEDELEQEKKECLRLDALLWVICCGVWWLDRHRALRLAEFLKTLLS